MKARRMCNKNDDHSAKSTKKKKKKLTTSLISPRPFRRARTKIKKPKFLSLSNTQSQMLSKTPNNSHNNNSTKKQLDLFPVHPDLEQEVPGPDRDPYPDPPENMADHMFSEDGPGPTTLTGLLNGAVSSTTSSGLSYAAAYRAQDSANSARSLVRTAMRRSRERDGTEEERWVSISDVVERRSSTAEEEVTSGGGGAGSGGSSLRLKLDYEEVLNAWSGSGKGPFYVKAEDEEEEELPQTVPDLRFEQYGVVPLTKYKKIESKVDFLLLDWPKSQWGVTSKGPWIVPENSSNGQIGSHSQTGGSTAEGGWKIGLREASVLRYKEKRQSRLFAKRIRYEVRKLNAEKRPRIKGRFVKRGAD